MESPLTLTIVLHNSAERLTECIRSIRPALDTGFARLVAVDNASPDESAELVAAEAPGARIVRSESNLGFARGANLAWPLVDTPYWMLLNPDVVAPSGGLETLVEWMDAHPDVAIASPELASPDGEPGTPGRALPSIPLTLLELTRLHRLLPTAVRGRLLRGPYWTGGDQTSAGWVPGAAMVARREAVEQIGPMSDSFFMYGEDLEWCWRARQAGWRIGVCSDTTFVHAPGSSAARTWATEERARRIAAGVVEAVRWRRGPLYSRVHARLTELSLSLEAVNPTRSVAQRERAKRSARAYREALRGAGRS